MKHLYLLIIFTISFSVYSQNTGSVFTYNFDAATNAAGFITAIDESESSWPGTKAQAGYVGVLGVPATNIPGAIKCPKDTGNSGLPKPDGTTAYYTQRYPNTNQAGTPSLNVDISSVVHYSVAFSGWQITHESNNNFQFNLKDSSNKMIACIKIEQDKSAGVFVDDKVRIVIQNISEISQIKSTFKADIYLDVEVDFDYDTKNLPLGRIMFDSLVYKDDKDEWDWQQCKNIPEDKIIDFIVELAEVKEKVVNVEDLYKEDSIDIKDELKKEKSNKSKPKVSKKK